ncbi:uncharacterized protein LOC107263005 [Cephus cinctus]|uniref:Uncharacterized protein LOC107263005 n=1 Tax=Cephus cinctus TaxID=211228 RepID=A0AAJ7R8N0_CEPCN|nr:uncharacterized protein LOC107263005 [Cephus cinctus]
MYPHPALHSFMQGCNSKISGRILNRTMDEAMFKVTDCRNADVGISRLSTKQPQCYAPHVDVTRARCGYRAFALSKLRNELHVDDPLIVRRAVTTIADILVNPEKLSEALKLRIPDRLSDLLVSQDSYLRERVAMAFITIGGRSAGREAILKNASTLCNLSKGLGDRLAAVRIKMALAVEMLSRAACAAEDLCSYGFIELIVNRLTFERKAILLVLLDILKSLLDRKLKSHAMEIDIVEKLTILLRRKDQETLAGALSCLAILCQESALKQVVIDKDLFPRLKDMLDDQVDS